MTMTRLLTATAAVALLAGPVAAQTMTQSPSGQAQTPPTDTTTQPGSPPPVATDDSTTTTDSSMSSMPSQTSTSTSTQGSMSTGTMTSGSMSTSTTAMTSGATTAPGLMMSMSGGVRVVSNAPIPDTVENRARYGQPDSNSGRARVGEGPVTTLPTRAAARATAGVD